MIRAAVAPTSVALGARLKRISALFERQGAWWTLGGCLLLALLLRVPYLPVPLGRDEGGLAFIARHWQGGSLYGDYWVDRPPLLIGLFKIAVLGGDDGVRVLGALAAVVLVVAIVLLARAVAGPRAGMIAGLLAAMLTGSVSIGAVYTPGELLAAVPSTLSVLCLVLAHRSRRQGYVIAAGALAVGAVLIKQSFLDAGFAGAVFLVASAASDRAVRLRWPIAYAAGAAAPLLVVLVWLVAAQVSFDYFTYTLFRFRLDLVQTLADSNVPLHVRLRRLEVPAWDSGLVLVLGGAVVGLLNLRGDRVLLVTCGAWLAAAAFGVLGGGSYFHHYLIQLVPVCSVAASALLARAPAPIGIAALGAVAALALSAAHEGVEYVNDHAPYRRERAVGRLRAAACAARRHPVRVVRASQRRLLRRPSTPLSVLLEPHGASQTRRAPAIPAAAELERASHVAGEVAVARQLATRPRRQAGARARARLSAGGGRLHLPHLRSRRLPVTAPLHREHLPLSACLALSAR